MIFYEMTILSKRLKNLTNKCDIYDIPLVLYLIFFSSVNSTTAPLHVLDTHIRIQCLCYERGKKIKYQLL